MDIPSWRNEYIYFFLTRCVKGTRCSPGPWCTKSRQSLPFHRKQSPNLLYFGVPLSAAESWYRTENRKNVARGKEDSKDTAWFLLQALPMHSTADSWRGCQAVLVQCCGFVTKTSPMQATLPHCTIMWISSCCTRVTPWNPLIYLIWKWLVAGGYFSLHCSFSNNCLCWGFSPTAWEESEQFKVPLECPAHCCVLSLFHTSVFWTVKISVGAGLASLKIPSFMTDASQKPKGVSKLENNVCLWMASLFQSC